MEGGTSSLSPTSFWVDGRIEERTIKCSSLNYRKVSKASLDKSGFCHIQAAWLVVSELTSRLSLALSARISASLMLSLFLAVPSASLLKVIRAVAA